jgi:hypothetical protein
MTHSTPSARFLFLFSLGLGSTMVARAQAPTLTDVTPAANSRAASRTGSVAFSFDQSLTTASAAALKVHSAQRGGQRAGGATPAVVSSNTLSFTPEPYSFMPGETVSVTLTTEAAGTGGSLGRGRVVQFTTAVGGTGGGRFVAPAAHADPAAAHADNLVLGDLDGDGDLDLITASSSGSYSISMGLNDGKGNFTIVGGTPNTTGQDGISYGSPSFPVLGDADGDGDLDLFYLDNGTHSVGGASVIFNDGYGSLTGRKLIPGIYYGNSLRLGDVDGDGDVDVLTTDYQSNIVSVRLNDGVGSFSGTHDVAVGRSPQNVNVGDVDSDGDLDLLTANRFGNSVSIRLNGGDGSGSNTGLFSDGVDVPAGINPSSLVVGDVDGDNDLDFLVGNPYDRLVSLRLNDGSGNFTVPANSAEIAVGDYPNTLTLGDVDGDGDLDLLTANSSDKVVSLCLNNGEGMFSAAISIGVAVDSSPRAATLGDVDGDGDLDLLTANRSNSGVGTVSVRLNQAQVLATAPTQQVHSLSIAPNPARGRTIITGVPAGSTVHVADPLGRPVLTTTADAAGAAYLVFPTGLAAGLYLVRSGGQVRRLAIE